MRALTNKGRALEILLKKIAQEKKQMEQRYVSMLANRDRNSGDGWYDSAFR